MTILDKFLTEHHAIQKSKTSKTQRTSMDTYLPDTRVPYNITI